MDPVGAHEIAEALDRLAVAAERTNARLDALERAIDAMAARFAPVQLRVAGGRR